MPTDHKIKQSSPSQLEVKNDDKSVDIVSKKLNIDSSKTKSSLGRRDINELHEKIDRQDLIDEIVAGLSKFDTNSLRQLHSLVSSGKLVKLNAVFETNAGTQKAPPKETTAVREFPKKAPALWAERTTGREVTPIDFIKTHYADFVSEDLLPENRLPRPLLRDLDKALYNAYAVWIKRHPKDDMRLPLGRTDVRSELDALGIHTTEQLRHHVDENAIPRKEYQRLQSGLLRKLKN